MKKYSITTTVNGKALVKQEHIIGTDGCTTSYGDVWAFTNCTEAGKWVDSELGIVSNAQRAMDAQKKSSKLKFEDLFKKSSPLDDKPMSNELNNIYNNQLNEMAKSQIHDCCPKSVEQILTEDGIKLEPNPVTPMSVMADILEKRERLLSSDRIKQDVGVELDKSQAEECVVNPETNKSLLEKIAEDEKVINE